MAIKTRKKNLRLVGATSMALFSLVAVFVATIAWFTMSNAVTASGMAVKVKPVGNSYKQGLSIHRCLTNESSSNYLSFNYASATSEQYKIDDYSQLNTTQPVLLLFPMGSLNPSTGEPLGATANLIKLTITSPTNAGYSDVNTTSPSAPNYYTSFPFSSACTFRTVAWTGNVPTNTTTNPSRYFVDYSGLESGDSRCYVGTTQSFVAPNGMSSLTWNGPTLTLFDGSTLDNAESTTIKYLGVVIDYYQQALSIIFRAGGYSGQDPVVFLMDFTMVIS